MERGGTGEPWQVVRKQNKTGDCFESWKDTSSSKGQKSSGSSGEIFWGDNRLLKVLDCLTSIFSGVLAAK